MDRRHCLRWMGSAMLLPISAFAGEKKVLPLQKSKQEWSKILPPASYKVLFEQSTEPAGTSPLLDEKREGTYVCAACHQPIFKSNAKYESGSGWPSFWQPIAGAIATSTDYKVGITVRAAAAIWDMFLMMVRSRAASVIAITVWP